MRTHMLHIGHQTLGRRATAVLGSAGNSIQCRLPICRLGERRMLRVPHNDLEVVKGMVMYFSLRLPRNCSGAIYGSLPHKPEDMCTVASQGRRYTVDAP